MAKDLPIKIPIIPYGLRQEETIVRIAEALDNINAVVTDVFQQIENNIQRHRQFLASLQKRTSIVASKVDKLAGENVITTVYSHHKFPFEQHNVDTLFKMNLKPLKKKIDVPIESKFQHAKYNKVPNKLQFFHIKSNANNSLTNLERGLGSLPPEINNIDSLFLFNSSQNVYEKYVMLDTLSIIESKSVIEETEKTDIAAAPNSIINSETFHNEDYFTGFYTPAFEEVPTIDVPANLPDLPGIAEDNKFDQMPEKLALSSKQVQEVDKSKSIDEITIADLPVISKRVKPISSSQQASTSHDVKNDDVRMSSELPQSAPLPPLPPSIPPPPPPLPVDDTNITNHAVATAVENDFTVTKKNVMPAENIHATLMEAIRKAGGKEKAQLRQVKETENSSISKDKDTNDLFVNDLWAALARRRKGISGQNKDHKGVSMMDRVSAMIDPTIDESDDDSAEDDENDWED